MTRWSSLIELARAQRGLLAVRQARALGLPAATFHQRVHEEAWARVVRSVYALPGVPIVAEHRARGAALAIGPHAVVTGRSALCIHGVVDRWPATQHLVVPAEVRAPRWSGVRVTRATSMLPTDSVERAGVRVATVQRALLDASPRSTPAEVQALLIDARQRGTDLRLVRARAELAGPHVPGVARVRAALEVVDAGGADSALTHLVEVALHDEGIAVDVPPRTVQTADRTLHPDVTIVGLPVGLECDGQAKYDARRGLDLDQRKHNAYRLAGWWMLRVGWRRIHEDRDGLLAELRQAIHQAERAAS